MSDEIKSPAELRAEMSRALLVSMAGSGDPQAAQHANFALNAQGLNSQGQPVTAAPAPAPVAAPAAAAPVPNTNAAPAPNASPAPALDNASLEALRDTNGLLLGKFRTADDLRRSYFSGQNLISQQADELIRLRNQPVSATPTPALLPGSAPGDAPRANPTAQSFNVQREIEELVKSSEESGQIDPQALLQTVAKIAARTSQEAVAAQLGPMQAISEAEAYMRSTYPDSVNHGQELQNFIKTDPIVGNTVADLLRAGSYRGAMEYAWSMYTVKNGLTVERGMTANAQIAEEERARARAAAGFSGSPNTGVHAETKEANRALTREEIAALNERSKSDGGELRRRVMLGQFLPPEWRTWEGQGQ